MSELQTVKSYSHTTPIVHPHYKIFSSLISLASNPQSKSHSTKATTTFRKHGLRSSTSCPPNPDSSNRPRNNHPRPPCIQYVRPIYNQITNHSPLTFFSRRKRMVVELPLPSQLQHLRLSLHPPRRSLPYHHTPSRPQVRAQIWHSKRRVRHDDILVRRLHCVGSVVDGCGVHRTAGWCVWC